ncbi:MAG: glycine zipper domain-containing protein, partial [Rhodocyclaceae bacterium]|nr:glycine zipper domain-containing protein [Rhodocyclaceae bacterium]
MNAASQKTTPRQRLAAAAVAGAFLASACATNPDGTYRLDDKAKGALMGAAAGAALAAATGHDPLKGAAIGAVAGFLISWYFESKKLADAKQVNKEYENRTVDGKKYQVPKNEVQPVAFNSEVKTAPANAKGEREVQVTSNTDLVGYGDKVPQMQQKYAIYDEKNNLVETKTEKIAAVDGAGRYQTNAKFKTPAEAKGKTYRVETTLLADNKEVKKNNYSISFLDDGRFMVAA